MDSKKKAYVTTLTARLLKIDRCYTNNLIYMIEKKILSKFVTMNASIFVSVVVRSQHISRYNASLIILCTVEILGR